MLLCNPTLICHFIFSSNSMLSCKSMLFSNPVLSLSCSPMLSCPPLPCNSMLSCNTVLSCRPASSCNSPVFPCALLKPCYGGIWNASIFRGLANTGESSQPLDASGGNKKSDHFSSRPVASHETGEGDIDLGLHKTVWVCGRRGGHILGHYISFSLQDHQNLTAV